MKNIKRICMALIVMMLSVTMVVGTLSFSAFALNTGAAQDYVSTETVKIVSKVKYGDSFDVPPAKSGVEVTVTAPNGLPAAIAGNKVTADQVGNYTVKYSASYDDGTTPTPYDYDFNVYCYIEEEYSIAVKLGGAEIPTYAKVDDTIKLPKAKLVYYDEDGNEVEAENSDVQIKTTLSDSVYNASGEAEVRLTSAGNVYITYFAKLNGGSKVYSKDFVVKVQDEVPDTKAPTLSIVNVPTNATLNRKVTLPTADASDDYDENVKIEVKVTVGGKNVTKVDVDDNGYAYRKDDVTYGEEEFDNDKNMSFYPTEDGATYTVTYQAVDDSGKLSALHSYPIKVSDTTAPVFKEVEDWKIPAKWGKSVKNGDGDADAKITFPVPTVVDNAGAENLTVSFKVTDPENNTVLSFTNILDKEGSGSTFTGNSSYGSSGESYKFTEDGFDFEFGNVKTSATTGDFTVEYGARDAKGNRSTKTYKINVTDEFEDSKKPNAVEIEDAPSYIAVAPDSDKFVVPAIDTSDEGDSRPHVVYALTSSADAEKSLNVSGGESLDIVEEDSKTYLVNKDDEKIMIAGGGTVTLTLTVTDKLGNSDTDTAEISVFSYDTSNDNLALVTDDLSLSGSYKVNEKVELGSFKITGVNESVRKFTGYELSVKDANGNYLTEVSSEYFYDSANSSIVVRNIEFNPGKSGVYQISVRAFDLSGNNIVKVALIKIEKGDNQTGEATVATIPSNGSINATYSFKNETIPYVGDPNEPHYVIYKIVGSRHSVMGTNFTAMAASSYTVSEGYAKYESASGLGEMIVYEPAYTASFTDGESPVIEVQNVMPSYSKKSTSDDPVTVTLPAMVAYSANGNGTISVRVRHEKSTSTVTTKYDEATNTYSFAPEKDGVYTIYVTGTVNSKSATVEYKLSVGDVVGPKFSLTEEHSTTEVVGKEFTFKALTAVADEGESLDKFTVTKRLIDPSGEVVSEATISGSYNTWASKTTKDDNTKVTLSKSGTYTVVYEVTDEFDNATTKKYTITVSNKTGSTRVSIAAISTVLIVVGVVLIVAVILYFVLFRKRKAKN